jgi:hypothetical protein
MLGTPVSVSADAWMGAGKMGREKEHIVGDAKTMPPDHLIDPETIDRAVAELAAGRKGIGLSAPPPPVHDDDRVSGEEAEAGTPALKPVDDDDNGDDGDGDSEDAALTEEGRKREIEAQEAELARQLGRHGVRQARQEKKEAARAHRGAEGGDARKPDAWRCDAPFAMLPWAVLCDASLGPRTKEVYGAIVRRAVQKNWITAGQELLADDLGCGVQTVSRAIHELKKCGLIEVQQRVGTSARTTLLPLSDVYSREDLACRLDANRRSDG